MDRILIEDLTARCLLGVNAEERRAKQEVVINIALATDTRQAAASDDFAQAVDYRAIKQRVLAVAEASEYYLVEALAERVAEVCLEHPGVSEAQVRVTKPSALRFARAVSLEITRRR